MSLQSALKTSLLSALHAAGRRECGISELAEECGVTRKALYDALEDLRFAGLLSARRPKQDALL